MHLDSERTEWVLLETVSTFEGRQPNPWRYDGGEEFMSAMARRVAAFEVTVQTVEAACKLSQDRSTEERTLIAQRLQTSSSSDERKIAALLAESVRVERRGVTTPLISPGASRQPAGGWMLAR